MAPDPAAARARRKRDLLMASALLREQATLALDDLQQRTEAVESTVKAWRQRLAGWAGAWARLPAAGWSAIPVPWRRPLVVGVLAAWGVARRRRKARRARVAPAATGSWAVGPLLLVALPRLWRWGRRGRRAWQILRWWRQRESASRRPVRS